MIEHSPDIAKLSAALHAAQGAVTAVHRDATNPHFKNRYATLEAVIETAKPALQASGIAFTQAPGALVEGAIEVTTMLAHISGQWLRSTVHIPLTKRDAQGAGSAITYGCRYALMAIMGLPPTDDDGEEASRPAQKTPPKPLQVGDRALVTFADRRKGAAIATVVNPREESETEATVEQRDYLRYARGIVVGMRARGDLTPEEANKWWAEEAKVRARHGLTEAQSDWLLNLLEDAIARETP